MLDLSLRLCGVALLISCGTGAGAQDCNSVYTVREGDTLSKIAGTVYGDVLAWDTLYQSNRSTVGDDPSRIRAGQKLVITCDQDLPEAMNDLQYVSVTPIAQPWDLQPSPAALSDLLTVRGTQVVDIRSEKQQAEGLIPGALSMPFSRWRGPQSNPGQPADDAKLSQLIGEAGLRLDQPIVIVHAKGDAFDTGRGAYVYWVLKSAGAQKLALLDGGHKSWVSAGLPLDPAPAQQRPYAAKISLSETWLATTGDVQDIVDGATPGILIDARPSSIWNKHDKSGAQVASTLPGASNIAVPASHKLMQGSDNDVVPLLQRLKNQGINWENEPVVHFCNTGELAALNWFHASEVSGISNVKLYPDSSHGWKAGGGALASPPEALE
ncbi:rhodanese-like domain-containing protein [Halovulum sp. GXIMD14793]